MRYDAMNRGILNGGDGVANHGGFDEDHRQK